MIHKPYFLEGKRVFQASFAGPGPKNQLEGWYIPPKSPQHLVLEPFLLVKLRFKRLISIHCCGRIWENEASQTGRVPPKVGRGSHLRLDIKTATGSAVAGGTLHTSTVVS